MAIVLHKNIKVFDVNRYINVKQMKPVFERIPLYTQHAAYTMQFEQTDSKRYIRVDDKPNRHIDPFLNPQFIMRSLDLFSEIGSVTGGDCQIDMTLKRIFPDERYDCEWKGTETASGILCVEKENVSGGLDQFRSLPNINYSEIDYEMTQGYLMTYTAIQHKSTPISCNYKDLVVFCVRIK